MAESLETPPTETPPKRLLSDATAPAAKRRSKRKDPEAPPTPTEDAEAAKAAALRRAATKEKRRQQRLQRVAELRANRPERVKRDLVAAAPEACRVWLAANPLDIALKTLREWLPGISAIFWLPQGGAYAAFETEAAQRHALQLGEVDVDGSKTRIVPYQRTLTPAAARRAKRDAAGAPQPVDDPPEGRPGDSDLTGDVSTTKDTDPDPSKVSKVQNPSGTPSRMERAPSRRELKARRQRFDAIPKEDAEVGYAVVAKGQLPKDGRGRHAGKPEVFLVNRPTFIATAALKKRLPGLEVVQWVQAPRDKEFRHSGFEGARAAFRSPEAAKEALSIVRYNAHGSDVFVCSPKDPSAG